MTDTMDEVLHAVGLGVRHLRETITAGQRELSLASSENTSLEYRLKRSEEATAQREERLSALRKERDSLAGDLELVRKAAAERHEKSMTLLGMYDAITLGLSLLIPELEAHRDNASTKAAGIAYGHVVERLLAIHTPAGHREASA